MWIVGLAGLGDSATAGASAPAVPVQTQLRNIPDGVAGLKETLRIMRALVREALTDPQQQIRYLAMQLLNAANVAPRDWRGEVDALHAYVRDHIRYTQDPEEFEAVADPRVTVALGHGDCDDKATLLAALLKSINHPAQFAMVGLHGEPFSHVLVETQVGERWLPLETILNVRSGWYPDGVTSKYVLKV